MPRTGAAPAGAARGGGRGDGRGGAALAKAVPRRPRVGVLAGLILAFGFGLLITPTIAIDTWLVQLGTLEVGPEDRAAITVRVPLFAGHHDGSMRVKGGGILVARGEEFGRDRAAATAEIYAATPRGAAPYLAYFLLCAALVAVYAHHLRTSNRGRLLRVQVVNLVVLVAVAVVTKIALLTTSVSVLAVPVAIAAIIPTLVFDRTVGLATGILSAVVVSLLVPFDVGVAAVLVAQAATAGILVPDSPKRPLRASLLAGLAAAGVAAFIYGVFTYLTTSALPLAELATPAASGWVAATAGGALAALLSMPLLPLYQILVGELTSSRLTLLQDLSNPLLRQIAEKSPGTWQHSLAMANMAEVAANEIGANGRLVRVGAYYHDLGKSLQAKYFIENIEPGETSPHEHLPPEVSCDAIFAHVTEGIVVARRAKLHERVIDFMHMHHGNGVLEYFWTKCQRQGNPKQLGVESFRYPGVPPQSRETAILAICDAVEAAARTLKKPDAPSIDSLVQRIVYGKLHLGQLDESGLSMSDLRRISDSLRETIRHAHHGRIEYPWQQEQRAQAQDQSAGVRAGAQERPDERSGERALREPRLDSLDAPRPPWHAKPTTADGRARSEVEAMAVATTAMGKIATAEGAEPPPAQSPVSGRSPASGSDSEPGFGARIGARVTRRGLGPPPAPGSTTGTFPLVHAGEPVFSDPAITTPRMTAPQPTSLAESSLAQRIDLAMGEDDDPYDSPFAETEEEKVQHREAARRERTGGGEVAGRVRREPSVMTSARREPDLFADLDRRAHEFTAETSPALPSYPGDADVTSQQPLAELEELAAQSVPSRAAIRRARDTHEIEADDIEAAIEVHPPARRNSASVVQPLPRAPSKPPR
jgi:cyclic-di-AMP phosphodiesterase PgpH